MTVPVELRPSGHQFASLDDIVDNGFCIGCGLCVPLAPSGRIEMLPGDNGHRRPRPAAPLAAEEEAAILRLCPGVNVTGPFGSEVPGNPVWGHERRVATGWATDPEVRHRASTGGVMTAVNRHLLASGRAAFIFQVEADQNDPMHSLPAMVRNPDDLLHGAQSRYASCSPLTALLDALDVGEPFAVSLKPCDVAAVRNLQRVDERAHELIVFAQAMFCGTVPNIADSLAILERRDIAIDASGRELVGFRWRGNGCPGPTEATLADGTGVAATYNELWVDHPWSTQFRCKICPDAVGLQADLATGDCWPGAVPEGESDGTNALIAHTSVGTEVLAECEAAGVLVLDDADPSLLDATQPHHVLLRQTFMTRVAAAVEAGLPSPDFTGLAAVETAAELSPEQHGEIHAGTVRRVRAGQADERTSRADGFDGPGTG